MIDILDRQFGWEPPERIGVAVSGGSDSLALLYLLHEWGRSELCVATVDHGLRKEAAEEAAYVARICASLDIPHDTLRWSSWDGRGNLQDQALQARYLLLAKWGRKRKANLVALGHQRDDVAETFLMRLGRRSGVDGLAAMQSRMIRHDIRFDRPFLDVRRSDLRAYLTEKSIKWVEDPSNDDPSFDRVKMRKALTALSDLGLNVDVLADVAGNLRAERQALEYAAYEVADRISAEEGGDVVLDKKRLLLADPTLQRRVLNGALRWVSSARYGPRSDALRDLTEAIGMGQDRTLHGCHITVNANSVRVGREANAVWDTVARLSELWDGRWHISGPEMRGVEVRALGDTGLSLLDDWRTAGLPRRTLLTSPAIWHGGELVAAPVAGFNDQWQAKCITSFLGSLLSH
nr:tRNA lysidine(34) synthetase TilS [Nereida sp. MMG025]